MRDRNLFVGLLIVIFVLLGLISWKLYVNFTGQETANASLDPALSTPASSPSNLLPTPISTTPPSIVPSISTSTPIPAPSVYPEATVEEQQAFATEFASKATGATPSIDWAKHGNAVFRLDSDPRILGSTIYVSVPKMDESITIYFKNVMDRQSVEQTIKKIPDENNNYNLVYPKLLFHWSSDTELHMKILASNLETVPGVSDHFSIDLTGAKTQDGSTLNRQLFVGVIEEPRQFWKASIDLSSIEKIADFDQPYEISRLDLEGRYYLLTRNVYPCYRCDAEPLKYSSLYDTVTREQTNYSYEIQLTTNYRGSGSFVVDRRGYFYETPQDPKMQVPISNTAMTFKLTDFVHGAAFTQDAKSIILITGPKDAEPDTKLDIRWIELSTRKETVLKEAVSGGIPQSQVSDYRYPVSFLDDGRNVYFNLYNYSRDEYVRYQLNWKSQMVTTWTLPVPDDKWNGFHSSDDGRYRIYTNYGLYRHQNEGDQLTALYEKLNHWGGVWIPKTQEYLGVTSVKEENQLDQYGMLIKVNAESLEQTKYGHTMFMNPEIVTISNDGKWVYITTQEGTWAL